MSQLLPKQLTQMLEHLNEDQLQGLYRLVADRLHILHKMRALYAMKDFAILDHVSFNHNGKYYEGVVTRLNQKTITVTLNDGNHWNVSPGFLTKMQKEPPQKDIQVTRKRWEDLQKQK